MASQTDEAERRVREQRALIERKLESLEGRVGDDLSHARARLQHHVTHAADTLPGGPQLIQKAEQHPTAALASGLGLGVAVGMMGGGGGGSQRDGSSGRDGGGGGGGASMLLGTVTNNLVTPLRPYLEDAAKQVVAGFSDRQRQQANQKTTEDAHREDGGQSNQ